MLFLVFVVIAISDYFLLACSIRKTYVVIPGHHDLLAGCMRSGI